MGNSSESTEQMYSSKLTFQATEEGLIQFKVSLNKKTKPKQMARRSEFRLLRENKCARELTCRGD